MYGTKSVSVNSLFKKNNKYVYLIEDSLSVNIKYKFKNPK